MAAKIVKLGLPDSLGKGHVSIPCTPTDTFETIIEKGLRLAFQAKRSNELLDAKGFYVSVRKGNKDVTLVGTKTLETLGMDSERMINLTLVPLDGAVVPPATPPTPSSPSTHSSPPLSPLRTPSSHTLSSSPPLSLGSPLSRTGSSNKLEGKKTKSPTAAHSADTRTPPPPPPGDDDGAPPPPPPSTLTPSSFSPRGVHTSSSLKKPLDDPPPPPPGGTALPEESDEESDEDVPGPPTSRGKGGMGADVDPPPPPPEFDGAPPPPRAASPTPLGRASSGKGSASKLVGARGGSSDLEGSSGDKRSTRRKKNSSVDSVGSVPLSPSAKSFAPGTMGPGVWHDIPGVCPGCGLGFGVGAIDAAMGKKFHSGHFICFHCGKNLANQKFFKHDGRPYCLEDEKKLFSNKCAECNKPITGDYMCVMGADYHTSCLRCVTCKTELKNKKYHAKDEKPYCEEHYHQLFGTICVGCGKPILEKILRALDAPWHVACFMCSHCLKPLDGTQFFLKNDNVYCPKDHEALFALRCKGCEQVIKGHYAKVEALNQNFHSQCLVCSVCQVALSGKSVYCDDRSDEVYCKEHYEATDAIKCALCHEYIRKEVLHAFDKAYHPDCYICKECKRPATRHVKETLFCDYHGQNAPKKGAPAPPPPPITSEVAKMYDDDDDDDDDDEEKEGKDEDPDSRHDSAHDGTETETETETEDPEEEERERKEKKREEEEKIKRAAELKKQEEEKKQRAEQTKKLNAEREKVRAKQEATRLEEEDRKRRETLTKSQKGETDRKKALDELKQQEAVYERQLAELAKQDAEAQSNYDKIRDELEEEERKREAAKAAKKAKKAEKKKLKGGSKGQTTTKKARGGISGHMGHLSAFISYGVSQCCPLKETPFRADYRRKDIYKPQLNNIDYDFLDFAPKVFQDLRERFGISQKAYVDSIVKQGITGGDTGAGKSGMLFFFSNDRRYVVKTITKTELKFTRKILKSYHEHMKANPHSLISRFYGLYKITMRDQKPLRLIVMNNLFDTIIKIHEKFDLKGSIRNRYVPDTESKDSHKGVLKDLNYKSKMYVGVTQKQVLTHQIKRDCEFLTKENIMDQSLLLGVHNGSEETDPAKGKAIAQISMKQIKNPLSKDPSRPDSGDLISIFQTNHMGIRGFDDTGTGTPTPRKEIYYMGVIDILQNFNLKKQLESTYKGIRYNKNAISAISSKKYAERFMEYLFAHFV